MGGSEEATSLFPALKPLNQDRPLEQLPSNQITVQFLGFRTSTLTPARNPK